MTILNVISIVILGAIVGLGVGLYRNFRRKDEEVDGFCGVNEQGAPGSSRSGDTIGDA